MVVSGVLPVLEALFLITTEISWLELSDLNHKLLRRMQLEAPGTFHHSLVVAGQELLSEALGIEPGVPDEAIGSMATLVLPGDSSAAFGEMDPLTVRLREEWQIEVPGDASCEPRATSLPEPGVV